MTETLAETKDALWFKDAIIYEIHIKAFQDSNADGIGDFQGLIDRLDYLQHLGVTTIWLLPFYPSPQRDGGYDISDYFSINPDYGTLKQFRRLMKEAHSRGLKVITELVINHTSDQHPWFQRARKAKPGSRYRDWYVWNDSPDKYEDVRIIFQDFEASNWSWDPVAEAYYWHRFYSHQPDLNFDNPEVQQEIFKILDFWIDLGVDGFRLDAIPYLFERENTNCENLPETHQFLKKLRRHAENKKPDVMLLAEANMWPEDSAEYFGDGDECHMNYHFPIMPRMFMALKMEDRHPIIDIIDQTPEIPENCQWGMFLRNHDELTLEMVTDEERDYMYQAYNKDSLSRINLGIRHRLAPLLDNHRHKIELMNCLLFSMPGTPVIYYGDEIGMGDNVYLGDRDGVRTPMQWSPDRNAGFSGAHPHKLFLPLINDPEYHYETINVETQQNNASSLYWWMKRTIAIRKRFKAFGRGDIQFLAPENAKVLAFTRSYQDEHLLILANLSRHPQAVELSLPEYEGYRPREVFGHTPFPVLEAGLNRFTLGPYGYYWFVLEPEESRPQQKLPELAMKANNWTDLFKGQQAKYMEENVLRAFLRDNRRYVDEARVLESVHIEHGKKVRLAQQTIMMLILKVTFTEGFPEWFFLPIGAYTGADLPGNYNAIAKLKSEDEGIILFDACELPEFHEYLLTNFLSKQKSNGKKCSFQRISGIRKYRKKQEALPGSRPANLKNSNLCLLFGDQYFMKIFHRLDQAVNPDLEINQFARKEDLPVPGYLAHLQCDNDSNAPFVLAMLQPYVDNQGAAGHYFYNTADRYIDRIKIQQERPALKDFPKSAERELSAEWMDILGNMPLQRAELLGQELAQLHHGLAAQPEADFRPEAFSLHYQRSLYAAFQPMLRKTFRSLEKHREIPGAEILIREKNTLRNKLKQIYDHKLEAKKVRLHGDLHLEKVLFTGKNFCFFDFEGDRQRDYRKLRLKKSPAQDLASLICSFYYIALNALRNRLGEKSISGHELLPWMEAWFDGISRAFLRGYLAHASAKRLLPDAKEDRELLLNVFILERHLYELNYEFHQQRDLAEIPLRGLLRRLGVEKNQAV
jgi:maltose alpha-D-glucosyltransferase/alpha-amylase